ncbi:hypothetical protein K461DRAFT_322991 [Myriangium duriaei CBS 260.36]|uniref:Uncharacterized protein n=1 Tax=Myriangium duriaei CBS 260.36 TaxID=1168546 RepID=A0A9P4MK99_9PEZI|nr:hypothetical protein K461DRAFT_322991 [Myriangium duriaei CBS 260.36]
MARYSGEPFGVAGIHETATNSTVDEIKTPHATVRLSTPALRATGSWYTLHWRPDDKSTILTKSINQEAHERKKERDRKKKERQKERAHLKAALNKKERASGAGSSADGPAQKSDG